MRCELCGKPAAAVCRLCGRPVCRDHYDSERRLCRLCALALCELCGRRLAIATCQYCGRSICENCSVQVTPVVRICKLCYEKLGKPSEWPPKSLRAKVEKEISTLSLLTLTVLRTVKGRDL